MEKQTGAGKIRLQGGEGTLCPVDRLDIVGLPTLALGVGARLVPRARVHALRGHVRNLLWLIAMLRGCVHASIIRFVKARNHMCPQPSWPSLASEVSWG